MCDGGCQFYLASFCCCCAAHFFATLKITDVKSRWVHLLLCKRKQQNTTKLGMKSSMYIYVVVGITSNKKHR